MSEVNQKLVNKVWSVVGKGLSCGLGKPEPGKMCVEAAVCYAMGLPHGDEPTCVHGDIRELKIALNDVAEWGSNKVRGKGMRRVAIAQLGSLDIDEHKWEAGIEAGFRKLLKPFLKKKPEVSEHRQDLIAKAIAHIADWQRYLKKIQADKTQTTRKLADEFPSHNIDS